MVRSGELIELEIEGFDYPVYTSSVNRALLDRSHESTGAPEASFIAPLDNLLWDRKVIKSLFQFEYTWEVYKRPQDRKYGYYVLPVLFGREFVARFEPVFDKKKRVLNIKNWWWEEGGVVTEDMKEAIRKCTDDFAGFLGAEKIAT